MRRAKEEMDGLRERGFACKRSGLDGTSDRNDEE